MPSPRSLARRYLPVRLRRSLLVLAGRDITPKAKPPAPKKPVAKKPAPKKQAPVKKVAAKPAAPAPRPSEILFKQLEQGSDLTSSVITPVRELVKAKENDRAISLSESLREQDDTRAIGDLASAVIASRRGFSDLAWQRFASVPREMWAAHGAQEYLRSGLAVVGESVLDDIRGLLADEPASMGAESWYSLLETTFGIGQSDLAREIFARFQQHVQDDPTAWAQGETLVDWMAPWVKLDPNSPTAPSSGRRTFAVMDYGHPGINRGSANIGDHVQTIASLGHLVRHQGVRLHGREDLVDLLAQLGSRVRPERSRTDVDADIDVITVHRDASMYEPIPEDTWILCFGWFMHALFEMRYGLPLHDNLRPIFVSFHCNKRELLTPEVLESMKRFGPIGCRDWTTTYLLTSLGVPAFFSGCLTTTIDTVFPDLVTKPDPSAPVAYVDVPAAQVPADGVTYKHSNRNVRVRSFITNVYDAVDLLETYRSKHSAVVSSRLHCYLPVRSLGTKIDFQPGNRSDIRFDGLINIDDDAFYAIRDGILGKLEQVFAAILGGKPEEEVYQLWRDLTADDVAAAQQKLQSESHLDPLTFDVHGEIDRVVTETTTTGPDQVGEQAIQVGVLVPKDSERALTVLLTSLTEHASRPLHVWLVADDPAEGAAETFAERFPELRISWVRTHGLAASLKTITGTKPSRQAIDRLLLAELLPEVDRLVLLPLNAVVTADVAELNDLDLESYSFATPTTTGKTGASGFGVIHGAASRLQKRTEAAAALRRTAHARHDFDFDSYTDSVVVVQLDEWRKQDFAGQALPLVAGYALNAREVLHYLAGPNRAVVPPRWAAVPTRSPIEEPGLIHWADKVKPWQQAFTPQQKLWQEIAARH